MTLEQFIGFSVFAFVACVTPGPNNLLLTAVGGSRGIRRGLPTLMGVAFGFALMLFLVAIGVGRTVLALEHFSGTVRWVGAAFLIWLAWNIASAPVANAGTSDNAVPRRRDGTGLVGAAFFQWVNPKAWLVCVGAISTYLSPGKISSFRRPRSRWCSWSPGSPAASRGLPSVRSFVERCATPAMLARSTSPWRSCL